MRFSNLPSTSTADSSGVLKWLFIVLILLVSMPLMAQQSKLETSIKQSWRGIDDAPYRIIPAQPPLNTSGETPKELGFDSIETLLSGVDKRTMFDSVAFSPDGDLIAAGSGDKTVRLWDVKAKALVHTFEGHTAWVSSVAFSPDGNLIASGSNDKTIRLWDMNAKTLVHTFEGHTHFVDSVVFSPDGDLIASGSRGETTVRLWDVKEKTLVHTFKGQFSVAFSPDGDLIASGSGDKTVRLWDVKEKTLVHTFEVQSAWVYSAAFSQDGDLIAGGSNDNTIRLWDVKAKTLVHTFEGHTDYVSSVAFSPHGDLIASGSGDKTVRLWDVKAKTLVHTFEGHTSPVNSVAFSPHDALMASASNDRIIRLWDVQAKTLVHTFEGHTDWVSSVAFSPDGALMATGSGDNTVRLWDMQTKSLLQTLVAGDHGNWLCIDRKQQVFRGDDGTLLKKRAIKNGNWLPVPLASLTRQDNFSISVAPESITIFPGESKEVRIQVTNTGAHPVYWLHLEPSTSDDEAIRLDPPNHLFKGKGEQEWKPARIAKLEPADTATLYARITPNLKLPASFISPGVRELVLTVVSANNTEVSRTINVGVQSPFLEWQRASLEQDAKTLWQRIFQEKDGKTIWQRVFQEKDGGKTLKIELQNSGTAALRDFTLDLFARGADSAGHTSDQSLSQQIIKELAPAAFSELAVVLPDGIDLKSQQLTLQGRTRQLPLFSWNLSAPNIERAVRWLYWILAPLLLMVLIALFFLRRYRHPLVVQLSSQPALLLKLPPEQLQDARLRLEQTRRFEQILSDAEVTRQTFSQAIAFIKEKAPQEKAQCLAKRLGTATKNLKPALWELRLPDNFPLNVDCCLLYFPAADSEPKAVFDDLKAIEQTRMRATVLFGPDSAYQRILRDKTKDRTNKLVAPSGSELTQLLLSPEPEIILAKILADQLTLTQLSPYQLGGGVNRESIFFGRQEIISHIMNRDPANYLVVSGRQLGKSSLLKALERRYLEQPDVTCRYLALSNEVLVPRLAAELGLSHETELEEIAAHMAERKGRFLFLIDEADKFVRLERETDYQILDALRRMSEEGHCHFILAGFWELYEHAVLDYQSPLKNFAEIVQIGELETEACRQLATLPMQNMRLTYAYPDLVDQLLEATGQRANLMAIACDQILKQLKPDQRIIQADDIQRSLYNDKTFNALKGWGTMTDDERACQLDRIVVYATVRKDLFDLAELVEILNQHGLKPDGQMMDHSLKRLELGFVLDRNEEGSYFYRVPLFREMILKENPAVRLNVEIDSFR